MGQTYSAPLNELRFVLHHVVGDGVISALPGYAEYSAEYADSVLEAAAGFAEGVLAPINTSGDRVGVTWTPTGVATPPEFKAAYERFVADGWTQLRGPTEFGGQAAPKVLCTAVEELWASANLAFRLCPMLTAGAVEAIREVGTPDQQQRFLPKLIGGQWTGTMNLTEPQAGSDLSAIRTRAVASGSHYLLTGQKIFITYGEHDYTENIIHLVLARIDGAPAGTRGISLFIVPKILVNDDGTLGKRNDVRCTAVERKLGIHASPTCAMSYGDSGGAIGYLVGEPNRGLEYMFIMMNAARLSVGLEGYALGERAWQHAAEWARNRVQGRGPQGPVAIERHADVQRMLLSMRSGVEAARALALYTALQLDVAEHGTEPAARQRAQARADLLIPIVKGWSTELGVTTTSLGIQVHGGMGYIEDTGAAQLMRDARIGPIYEGTTGIQALDLVGRKVGRDGGVAMFELVSQLRTDLQSFVSGESETFDPTTSILEALDHLDRATISILDQAARGPAYVQAVAVPYLHLCGLVLGGAMMAKAYRAATALLQTDPAFHRAKRRTARFFIEHLLPAAGGLAHTVRNGAECVVDEDPGRSNG